MLQIRNRTVADLRPLRISIVMPNYNGAAFVEEALKSVAGQDYPALEFIVVDGASDDGSLDIIRRYEDRIDTLIVEKDDGHADAINKGLRAAVGDILGWINSDDILFPNALDFIARLFSQRPDIEWITGRASSMGEDGRVGWIGPLRPWSRLRFLSGDCRWIQQESTFWRRSLWERAGGELDLRYKVANDFDLWRRFFRHAELHSVDRYLGCFRVREGQRSIRFKSLYESEMRAILADELKSLDADYRAAFDELVPATPARAKPAPAIAADPRYRIADPPLIRAGEVLGWSKGEFANPPRWTAGAPLARAFAPSDLSPFKDLHRGERCFVMGNGPSLNLTDLSKLAGETVFACNAVFLLFDRIAWRPAYYACVDSRVLPDRAADIDRMLRENPATRGFFPAVLQEHTGDKRRRATRMVLPPAHNRYYFNERPNSEDNLPHSMFSRDIDDYVVQPFTVAVTMLQIAAYMGFREIVLIGCDANYVVPATTARGRGEGGEVALTSTRDDDRNHFDPRYFGRNRKWHDPQPEKMIAHYEHAKRALDAIGVTVYNATVGGRLEAFPRRPLEDFVPKRPEPAPALRPPPAASLPSASAGRAAAFRALLWRSRGIVAAALAAAALIIAVAALFRDTAAAYFVGATAFLVLLGVVAAVALKLRAFIAELSRQVMDIASGAGRPPDGAVLNRLEMEDELTRLREEVGRLARESERNRG